MRQLHENGTTLVNFAPKCAEIASVCVSSGLELLTEQEVHVQIAFVHGKFIQTSLFRATLSGLDGCTSDGCSGRNPFWNSCSPWP